MSTSTLYNEKKKTLVPQLRFREFDGVWKEILLEDFAKRGSGHTPNKSYPEYYNGEINWISLTDSKKLDNGYIEFTNTKITELGLDNSSAVLHPAGSVLLSRDAGVGKSAVMKHSMAVSQHFIVWRPKENVSSNWFLYNVLQILKPEFERIAIGNTIKTIGLPYFKKLKITAPTFPEQQKIASFLGAVDEKIQQLSRKKELLEQYKKGVMQQLFSGKLRFKDENGDDYADWEEKNLGVITNIKKGKQLNKVELTETGDYLCINGGISPSGYTDNFNTLENTITISEGGNSCGFINFFRCKFWSGGHNYTIEMINPEETDNDFMFQILKQNQIEIMSLRVGSGLPNIQKKDLVAYPLNLPSSLKEQQKIATFLSNIDAKIFSTSEQITQTQSFKKGLLQQMFV